MAKKRRMHLQDILKISDSSRLVKFLWLSL